MTNQELVWLLYLRLRDIKKSRHIQQKIVDLRLQAAIEFCKENNLDYRLYYSPQGKALKVVSNRKRSGIYLGCARSKFNYAPFFQIIKKEETDK